MLMDANVRTGEGIEGERMEDDGVLGACGRDELNDNGKRLLWHRPISKRFIKLPYSISRAASINSYCYRLPTTRVLSNKADKLRSNQF